MTQKNKKASPLYVLVGPKGEQYLSSVAESKRECWTVGFNIVVKALGEPWMTKYWRRWEASIAAARRAGYRIVGACLVLAPSEAAVKPVAKFKKGDKATWSPQGGRATPCEVLGVSESGARVKILLEPPHYPYRHVTHVTPKRLVKG